MSGSPSTRGAIVMSYWDWRARNVPERLATALSRAGWRVLYCSNPSSFLRGRSGTRTRLAENVEGFAPRLVGHRLNTFTPLRRWQARFLVSQVLRQARRMDIARPLVIYPHGEWLVAFARELKARGIPGVYLCMDHAEESEALAAAADMVLVIPPTLFRSLNSRFGDKVRQIPQLGSDFDGNADAKSNSDVPVRWETIPRPRLAYLGMPANRLHTGLVDELLTAHPEWQILTCGPVPGVKRPNLHDVGWIGPAELAAVCHRIDVGFMPYDCGRDFNLHCVPLKLFDYFAAGLPVVSTSLIHLAEYRNLVYLGDTADELAEGIRKALAEPSDDPRREERRRIARAHSLDEMSRILPPMLIQALESSGVWAPIGQEALTGADDTAKALPSRQRSGEK
jgi:hypothetical protein